MKRIYIDERPDWRQQADQLGFLFHSLDHDPCWDETRVYVFTMDQIENELEDVTEELYALCLAAVDVAVRDEQWMRRLAIPEIYWDWIAESWKRKDPALYGRFDFRYDGNGPAKMLEFNADTPTTLYEAGFFQWHWLEDQQNRGKIPKHSDQFNSIQERLIDRFAQTFEPGAHVHFTCCKGIKEDRATVEYLEDCAVQAGLNNHFVYIEDIGIDKDGRFADESETLITDIFKLYPYEDMLREPFGKKMPKAETRWIEPPWKAILSNKGILPLLWHLYPDHPNLLPSFFEDELPSIPPQTSVIRKPLFSREGANVEILGENKDEEMTTVGPYGEEGYIVQQFIPLPKFDREYAVIGSWIVGDMPAGMGVREDDTLVTQDLSRFVPHIILD